MSSPNAISSFPSFETGFKDATYVKRYAAPIWEFLLRPDVQEVAINPDETVWVESNGQNEMVATNVTVSKNHIEKLTQQIAGQQGTKSGRNNLITSAMLDVEGNPVRVQCVLPPACAGAGSITIRKFSQVHIPTQNIKILHDADADSVKTHIESVKTIWDASKGVFLRKTSPGNIATDDLSQDSAFGEIAEIIVKNKLTVLVSGGTSSGKTTILKALLAHIPKGERIITIEDVPELVPDLPNYVPLMADRDSDVRGPKQLLASVLRMRPDRFMLGELRGDEARMFMEAINTGHAGSLSTMHANSAERAINRLVLMGMGAASNVSARLMVSNICDTIDIILQCGKNERERGLVGYYVPSEHAEELRTKF